MLDKQTEKIVKYYKGEKYADYLQNLVLNDINNSELPECLKDKKYFFRIDKNLNFDKNNIESFYERYLKSDRQNISNCNNMFKNGAFLRDFTHIVESLNSFVENNQLPYYLSPKLIKFYDDKLMLQKKDLDKFLLSDSRKKINKNEYDTEFLLSKVAKNQMVSKQDLNLKTLNSLIAYLFFCSVIPDNPNITKKELSNKVEYLTVINPALPMELTELIKQGILGNIEETPIRYFKDIVDCFKNSINKECKNKPVKHLVSYYSQTGLNKRFNEDIIYTLQGGDTTFIVVSDGVTNAEIGQGGQVSSIILQKLRNGEKNLKKMLLTLDSLTLSHEEWQIKVKDVIIKILTVINEKVVKEINDLIKSEKLENVKELSIMAATINIVIVTNNWGLIGWLGDSPAYLFRNGKLISLLDEHNSKYETFINRLKGKKNKRFEKEEVLSRVIPFYSINNSYIETEDMATLIQFKNFFLKVNDKFITGSDGIIDNMDGVLKKDKINEFIKCLDNDSNAYDITHKGVNGSDNISCAILTISHKRGKDE